MPPRLHNRVSSENINPMKSLETINFSLKPMTVADETTVSGREFQTLMTRFEKKFISYCIINFIYYNGWPTKIGEWLSGILPKQFLLLPCEWISWLKYNKSYNMPTQMCTPIISTLFYRKDITEKLRQTKINIYEVDYLRFCRDCVVVCICGQGIFRWLALASLWNEEKFKRNFNPALGNIKKTSSTRNMGPSCAAFYG